MKTIIFLALAAIFNYTAQAQMRNVKTETIKIFGNCDMCKSAIDKAGTKNRVYKTDWNVTTKMAAITYDNKSVTADDVLKEIALAGYDNEKYLAPDDAYNNLQGCCKYVRENKTATKVKSNPVALSNHDHNTHTDSNTKEEQANQLKTVFDNYFGLKDALVKTDGVSASAKASEMLVGLNAVDMTKLNSEEHTAWMKVEKNLKFNAQHIKENKATDHQREHFISLSKDMFELIKASKQTETIYYQFCPMANDGKGANWLSKESAIKNPYYGSQMLTCGSTVETIKQ